MLQKKKVTSCSLSDPLHPLKPVCHFLQSHQSRHINSQKHIFPNSPPIIKIVARSLRAETTFQFNCILLFHWLFLTFPDNIFVNRGWTLVLNEAFLFFDAFFNTSIFLLNLGVLALRPSTEQKTPHEDNNMADDHTNKTGSDSCNDTNDDWNEDV